jgi:hypothetical protein
MANGQPPVATFRIGFLTSTVWKTNDHYDVELARRYKDGNEWKETNVFRHDDLLNAVRVLQKAEDFISVLEFQREGQNGER